MKMAITRRLTLRMRMKRLRALTLRRLVGTVIKKKKKEEEEEEEEEKEALSRRLMKTELMTRALMVLTRKTEKMRRMRLRSMTS
jgi:hypothetical protein